MRGDRDSASTFSLAQVFSSRDGLVDHSSPGSMHGRPFEAETLLIAYSPSSQSSLNFENWWILVQSRTISDSGSSIAPTSSHGLVPTQFELRQNHPNPFVQATQIEFDLPVPSQVRLEIFDTQGRRVARVIDARYSAGRWSVEWRGRTDWGNAVQPGVYLYRIDADQFHRVRKLVLLR